MIDIAKCLVPVAQKISIAVAFETNTQITGLLELSYQVQDGFT